VMHIELHLWCLWQSWHGKPSYYHHCTLWTALKSTSDENCSILLDRMGSWELWLNQQRPFLSGGLEGIAGKQMLDWDSILCISTLPLARNWCNNCSHPSSEKLQFMQNPILSYTSHSEWILHPPDDQSSSAIKIKLSLCLTY
jgi:hypothetical protein